MRDKPSTIEINGQKYDALSGRLVGAAKKVISPFNGTSMDGVIKKPIAKVQMVRQASKASKKPAQAVHAGAQRTKTLVREVVNKQRSAQKFHKRLSAKALRVNPVRISRAIATKQHTAVKRFGIPRPSKELLVGEILQPKVAASVSASTVAVAPVAGGFKGMSSQQLERLLDAALLRADAHKQQAPGRLGRRSKLTKWSSIAFASLLVIIVAGVILWQKVPALSVKLAGSKAHVHASAPTYAPAGFRASPAKAENDVVSITYTDKSDPSKSYTIKQQANGQIGVPNVPTNAGSQVQTAQIAGLPVSIITDKDNSEAVANSAGVQCTLIDKAGLPPSEMAKILGGTC